LIRDWELESTSLQRAVSREPIVFSQGVLCPDAPPQGRRAPQDRLLTGEAINDLAGVAGEIDKKASRRQYGAGASSPSALFRLRRYRVTAAEHRASRNQTFQVWDEMRNMGWQ
jgi:hypothetical protein